MEQRTMVMISADEKFVSIRTYSRKYGRSGQFVLFKRELEELTEKGSLTSIDGFSYARFHLCNGKEEEKVLKIEIVWLKSIGDGDMLSGRAEWLSLIFQEFQDCVEESSLSDGKNCRLLSLPEHRRPSIDFSGSRNLEKVVCRKGIRKKLGKFLDRNFRWPDAVRIVVSDDMWTPYSFFFQEERANGTGICGGIILHGQEDIKKAYYGIHT